MNYEEHSEPEIDLKELFFHILYRWRSIMVAAILFCVLVSAYKLVRNAGLTPEELVPRKMRIYELDLAKYELNKSSYERLISDNTERLERQQIYLEKSVLMHIDPYHMPVASADIFVRLDDTEWEGLPDNLGLDPTDSLIKMYTSNFLATLDWKPIEELTNNEKLYLEEILGIGADYSSNTITVRVVHSDGDTAREILDIVLNQLLDKQEGLADGIGRHSLTVANQSLTYTIDQALAESQKNNIAAITEYERSIVDNRAQLDELKENEPTKPFIVGFIKFPVAGFALGVLLMVVFYGISYFFDGKLHGKRSLQYRYGYRLLGVFPHPSKKPFFHCVDRLLDRLSNDCTTFETNEIYKRISINALNMLGENKNILVTGTAKLERMQEIADAVMRHAESLTLTASQDTNRNSETLIALAKCDAVLLVEEVGKSLSSDVRNECADIIALEKPVVGYVLL